MCMQLNESLCKKLHVKILDICTEELCLRFGSGFQSFMIAGSLVSVRQIALA